MAAFEVLHLGFQSRPNRTIIIGGGGVGALFSFSKDHSS